MNERRDIIRCAVDDLDARCERYEVTEPDGVDAELRRLFLDHLVFLAGEAERAVGESRFDLVVRQGHSIKGMGGSCGAPEISVAGEELERMARAGSADRCRAIIEAIKAWGRAADGAV